MMTKELLIKEINRLRLAKNAVILAHYYQIPDIQDVADFVGDSLDLSVKSAETNADIIVFAGVKFMAETAKILSPDKKVLIPDIEAGCSLSDSCPENDFRSFKESHPNHIVVSYVNTSVEIKALTDITCTSTNAVKIINSIPKEKPIIFAPDYNLGSYLSKESGRELVLWKGACHVHEEFSLQRILDIKKEKADAILIAHPECQKPIQIAADFVGSTSALLDFASKNQSKTYIVATESGILYQMRKKNPDKEFIPAPPIDSTCGCSDCEFMKLHNLTKIYECLKEEKFEIMIEKTIIDKAKIPIQRMFEITFE